MIRILLSVQRLLTLLTMTFLVIPLLSSNASASGVTDCDRAASHPLDPLRKAPGVALENVNTFAVITCGISAGLNAGDPRFRYLLGRINLAAGNPSAAAEQFGMAVRGGYPMAFYDLGVLYFRGEGVAKDQPSARKLIVRAADLGVPIAQQDAGQMLQYGIGGAKDLEGARRYYELASSAGLTKAAEYLAALEPAWPNPASPASNTPPPETTSPTQPKETSPAPAAPTKPSRKMVREIQQRLTALGYDPGTPDGLMGRRTRAAIRAFETDTQIPVTGQPTEDLLARLQASDGSGGSSAPSGSLAPVSTAELDSVIEGTFTPRDLPEGREALAETLMAAIERETFAQEETPATADAPKEPNEAPAKTEEAAAPTPSADRNLVIAIQALLNRLGYASGPPTGQMNDETTSAIIAYQAVSGLTPDGLPSTALRDHLVKAAQ